MTQENILVSPNVSACLKPGNLWKSDFTAFPGLSPAKPGDTAVEPTLVGPVCPSGPLSTHRAHESRLSRPFISRPIGPFPPRRPDASWPPGLCFHSSNPGLEQPGAVASATTRALNILTQITALPSPLKLPCRLALVRASLGVGAKPREDASCST